jgi:hypothetical protein
MANIHRISSRSRIPVMVSDRGLFTKLSATHPARRVQQGLSALAGPPRLVVVNSNHRTVRAESWPRAWNESI